MLKGIKKAISKIFYKKDEIIEKWVENYTNKNWLICNFPVKPEPGMVIKDSRGTTYILGPNGNIMRMYDKKGK